MSAVSYDPLILILSHLTVNIFWSVTGFRVTKITQCFIRANLSSSRQFNINLQPPLCEGWAFRQMFSCCFRYFVLLLLCDLRSECSIPLHCLVIVKWMIYPFNSISILIETRWNVFGLSLMFAQLWHRQCQRFVIYHDDFINSFYISRWYLLCCGAERRWNWHINFVYCNMHLLPMDKKNSWMSLLKKIRRNVRFLAEN